MLMDSLKSCLHIENFVERKYYYFWDFQKFCVKMKFPKISSVDHIDKSFLIRVIYCFVMNLLGLGWWSAVMVGVDTGVFLWAFAAEDVVAAVTEALIGLGVFFGEPPSVTVGPTDCERPTRNCLIILIDSKAAQLKPNLSKFSWDSFEGCPSLGYRVANCHKSFVDYLVVDFQSLIEVELALASLAWATAISLPLQRLQFWHSYYYLASAAALIWVYPGQSCAPNGDE